MIRFLRHRYEEELDDGFTLIELMVVVLIIAILLAIAIPTFLGARNTANTRAAQSNINTALTAEQTYFTDNNQVYGAASDMSTIEPSLTWSAAASGGGFTGTTTGNTVFIDASGGTTVYVGALGKDGKCYWAQDNDGNVTYTSAAPATAATCTTVPTNWTPSW